MKYTFTIVLTFVSMIAFGQVEEWIKQAKTAEGKAKVDLYNQIAEHYTFDSEPFSAKTYAQKAIEIADDLDYNNGLAVGYFYLAEAYSLNDEISTAEKTYKKWYKLRKKYGTEQQLNWATIGMARFYQSQEHDRKTECYFKKALKNVKEDSYREFAILQSLADYYQHGKNYRTDRELNLKKASKYLELVVESGRKLYGKDFSIGNLNHYFRTEIIKALENKQTNLANTIGEQWLKSQAKFVDNETLCFTARRIARYFFDKEIYTHIKLYLDKSIAYAKKDGDNRLIRIGLQNATYMMRFAKEYEQALEYCFETLEYGATYDYTLLRRLKGCVYPMLKENNPTLTQKITTQLEDWQKTLDKSKYETVYEGTEELLTLMKK
ncbi:MAG: hypothetical protein AB8G11_26420 [Saprospiraceae bacterium]